MVVQPVIPVGLGKRTEDWRASWATESDYVSKPKNRASDELNMMVCGSEKENNQSLALAEK